MLCILGFILNCSSCENKYLLCKVPHFFKVKNSKMSMRCVNYLHKKMGDQECKDSLISANQSM